jgi:hypothetical protein
MDSHMIALLIPIVAMGIPIAAVVFHGMQKVAALRLEEARLRAASADTAEVEALRGDVAELRQELLDVQERLDFAERALVQSRDPGRLPGAGNAT